MLVCVEAGLGIDACFTRVGAEITVSHPLLAELLATVSLELRAGRAAMSRCVTWRVGPDCRSSPPS